MSEIEITLLDEYLAECRKLSGHLGKHLFEHISAFATLDVFLAYRMIGGQQVPGQLEHLPPAQRVQSTLNSYVYRSIPEVYQAIGNFFGLQFLKHTMRNEARILYKRTKERSTSANARRNSPPGAIPNFRVKSADKFNNSMYKIPLNGPLFFILSRIISVKRKEINVTNIPILGILIFVNIHIFFYHECCQTSVHSPKVRFSASCRIVFSSN